MSIERVIIFGLGAAGSNIMLNLAHTHPALSFVGLDDDKVETRNYLAGTQPYVKGDVNRPKVQAMLRVIRAATDRGFVPMDMRLTHSDQIPGLTGGNPESCLLVDAFDHVPSRNLFTELPPKYNVLHVGFSAALQGTATWNESWRPMVEDESDATIDVCQMHMARPFIMALTGIASTVAADFIDTGRKMNIYFDARAKKLLSFPV